MRSKVLGRPPGREVEALFAQAVRAHEVAQHDIAAALYEQILQRQPRHADALHLRGVLAAQRGDAAAAVLHIGKAVALRPRVPAYRYNLALALAQAGQAEAAMAAYRMALGLQADYPGAHYNLANLLAQGGRLAEAIRHYRAALAQQPGHADALNNLGAALSLTGQLDEAIYSYRAALAVDATIANSHFNLGKLLQERGALAAALECYAQALALRPDFAEAHSNRGNVLRAQGQHEAAVAAYEAAIHLAPGHAAAFSNLGVALKMLGRLAAAQAACRQAIALQPDCAAAYCNLASALQENGETVAALAACEAALRLQPDFAEAHRQHGALLADSGCYTEACAAYATALAQQPDLADAHNDYGNLLGDLGQYAAAEAEYHAALRLRPEAALYHSNLIMSLYYRDAAPGEVLRAAQDFGRMFAAPVWHFANTREPERGLRIGYVSADFRRHPVGYFLAPVLPRHEMEVVCYSNAVGGDDLTAQLQRNALRWRNIHGLGDAAVAQMVAADEIDILVDLSGHTGGNRLGLFAGRAAPVQVSWLGFWGTTGLPAMDYILTDALSAGPEEGRFYSECVWRLDQRFCYAPPDYAPAVAPRPGGQIMFGSFNNLAKAGPDMLRLWAQILRDMPEARLLLKWQTLDDAAVRAQWLRQFAALGIAAERLVLRGASAHAAMLGEYGEVDVALDCFPFSGGLTSCEALWMGVPVVTCPGALAVSRQTAGILTAIGQPELVAEDSRDYRRIAVALAGDTAWRADLRKTLRPRMAASPLCDGAGFTRQLEAAYRGMWLAYCAAPVATGQP